MNWILRESILNLYRDLWNKCISGMWRESVEGFNFHYELGGRRRTRWEWFSGSLWSQRGTNKILLTQLYPNCCLVRVRFKLLSSVTSFYHRSFWSALTTSAIPVENWLEKVYFLYSHRKETYRESRRKFGKLFGPQVDVFLEYELRTQLHYIYVPVLLSVHTIEPIMKLSKESQIFDVNGGP